MQQQTNPAEPGAEAEQKAPASIAGKWDMSDRRPHQGIDAATLDVKQDGKKITRHAHGSAGRRPGRGRVRRRQADVLDELRRAERLDADRLQRRLKEDGTLAGTLDFGQGQIPWTRRSIQEDKTMRKSSLLVAIAVVMAAIAAAAQTPTPTPAPPKPINIAGKWS